MEEENNVMYLAYVRSDVEIGVEVGGYVFTESKRQSAGCIILLKKYGKKKDLYIQWESRNIFHADWLKCVTESSDEIGIASFRQEGVRNSYRIARYISTGFNSKIIDIETEERITSANNFWASENIISRFGATVITQVGRTENCEHCGKAYLPMFGVSNRDMCFSCFEKMSIRCNHCGVMFIKKDQNTIIFDGKNVTVCDTCLSKIDKCETCGKPCFSEDEYKIVDEQCVCNECWGKSKQVRCDYCGNYYDSDKVLLKKDGHYICSLCHFEKIVHSKIREYSYKPNPIMYNNDGERSHLYFGVELEINTPNGGSNRDTFNRYIEDKVNYPDELIYCKFDRSIGNDGQAGFEIVTHPMSYPYIIGMGKQKIESIMALSKMGCRSFKTDTCGMHVHMSKNQFNTNHLYRFLKMFFDNKDFNILVSERTNISKVDEFCSFVPDTDLRTLADMMANSSERHARHKAVNLACPSTVEVRIFRGTLNYSKFMKNIEYCKAVYDFTKDVSDSNVSVNNFKSFVRTNSINYENLFRFLDKKNVF